MLLTYPFVAVRALLKFNIFVVRLLLTDVLHVIFPLAVIVCVTLSDEPLIVRCVPVF